VYHSFLEFYSLGFHIRIHIRDKTHGWERVEGKSGILEEILQELLFAQETEIVGREDGHAPHCVEAQG